MEKDKTLKEISQDILGPNIEEKRFSNTSRLEELSDIYGENEKINKILIMGINPAGDSNEYDEKHIGFIPGISNEEYENKIKAKLSKEQYKNLFNINYFKSNYNLFSNAKMTWGISEENKERLKVDLEKLEDTGFVNNIITKITENPKDETDRLIFVDLVYYHNTDAKKVKSKIKERYKNNYENLKSSIECMLKKHIKMFNPSLIISTNAFVSDLLYGLFGKEEITKLDSINKETIENDSIKINNVPIVLAGMVSREMDKYSYYRLKKRIADTLIKQ